MTTRSEDSPGGAAPAPFVCRRCGACCRAPGEVRLLPGEPGAIARLLGLDEAVFLERLTRLAANRQGLALTERADGVCVFLVAGNGCAIQAVKPRQCRDYPALWRSDALDRDCAGQRVGRAGCPRSSSDDPEPT